MNRTNIGLVTLVVLSAGGWAWLTDRAGLAGVTLRVGAVMAALFVSWPALSDVRLRSWWWIAAAGGLVAWRPRAAWLVIPVLFLVATRRRDSN